MEWKKAQEIDYRADGRLEENTKGNIENFNIKTNNRGEYKKIL